MARGEPRRTLRFLHCAHCIARLWMFHTRYKQPYCIFLVFAGIMCHIESRLAIVTNAGQRGQSGYFPQAKKKHAPTSPSSRLA